MAAKSSEGTGLTQTDPTVRVLGEEPPKNVVEAWNRVLRDMPAIGKENRMQGGGGYNFRSIEQFTAEAAGLFARHGVIVIPRVREIEYVDVGKTQSGAVQFEARGIWDWDIYGPAGAQDVIHATSAGQGRDSADKAANKAATAAFKYLLMPALMVSDRKDDPDHERPETEGHPTPAPAPTPEEQEKAEFNEMVYQLCVDLKKLDGGNGPSIEALFEQVQGRTVNDIKRWIASHPETSHEVVTTLLSQLKAKQEGTGPPDTGPPPEPEPKPPRAPRTRAKTGSALTEPVEPAGGQMEAATNVVKGAFPGTTEEK